MKLNKKTLLPIVALPLVSLMLFLPSCGSTYQVTMDGWENGSENSASEQPEGGEELSLPEQPSLPEQLPPAQSLLPDETTDPVTNTLKDLLDMKQYTDAGFVGFSYDLRYFVADFRGTLLEEQYGAGCYLLMLNETIPPEALAGICQKLKEQGIYDQLFQVEKAKELINEGLSKLEKTPELKELILCYFDEETMGKISEFLATEQGSALLCLYRHVEAPVEGYPLLSPVKTSDEPAEKFSTKWLEWLTTYDMGDTYPMIYSGGLYNPICWKDLEPSAWELWPYDATTDVISEKTHFHLNVFMDSSEFDGRESIEAEDPPFTWKIFYRELDSTQEYKSVTCAPWGAITFGDNFLYRMDLYSAGMTDLKLKEDGSANTYHMIFMILDRQGEVMIWRDETVKWTNSSQKFLDKAIELGVVEAPAPVDPCPEIGPEPGLVYP